MNDQPRREAVPRHGLLPAVLVAELALAAALTVGHLVAAFVGRNASPVVAVGASAIDLTPTWLKDFAVRAFGSHDKAVLLGGIAVVLVAAGVAAGALSRRSALPGTAIVIGLGVVGLIAVGTRPDTGSFGLLAPLAALVVGTAVFRGLHRLARGATDAARSAVATAVRTDRRRFLLGAGGVAVGAGLVAIGAEAIGATRAAARDRIARRLPRPIHPARPVPAGADFASSGTPTFLTANPAFYRVDTALLVPNVSADDWTLRVHGLVDRELRLGFADIAARPLVERIITLTCVSNEVGGPYISTARFLGVELHALLADAGVRPGAEQLLSTSVDGFTAGTPVQALLDPARGALLAIGMNGEPIPREHGYPARLVVPGLYGYVSATKWVTDLELTTWAARRAYWLKRGWARRAPIKTQSRIDMPKGFQTVPAGRVTVAGIAWAQTIGIERVEVQLDGGPWQPAELSTEVSEDTWRMWRSVFHVPPGNHRVTCRATDRSGYTQTPRRQGVVPDGATGWHSTRFTAR